MNVTCEYCHGTTDTGETTCKNCGAPIMAVAGATDLHNCPFCGKRLLALGSPSCNYCGKRLPPEFIAAREADLHRVTTLSQGAINSINTTTESHSIIEVFKQTTKTHSSSPVIEILTDIADLLS